MQQVNRSAKLSKPDRQVNAVIDLPASKSISNRALIINALSGSPHAIDNLSTSDDTRVMQHVLTSGGNYFDIGHAGTAMRFLTAYFAHTEGERVLTGSPRMKQRPIKILTDALAKLGAMIEHTEKEGFPPLKIRGTHLTGRALKLEGSVSSQYISALLMIAPVIEGGLAITLENKIASRPYIAMTLKLMEQFGIKYSWTDNTIRVPGQKYDPVPFTVETDWSGASYWYEILALADEGRVELLNLRLPSIQGDSAIAGWMKEFGIESAPTERGIAITKKEDAKPAFLELDFSETPDIAQTMAVLCVVKQIPFRFTGLATLSIKETDRIAALLSELKMLGAAPVSSRVDELAWDGCVGPPYGEIPSIKTWDDHRMALAFAPAALVSPIVINDPLVVTKSYPSFYDDLRAAGFIVDM